MKNITILIVILTISLFIKPSMGSNPLGLLVEQPFCPSHEGFTSRLNKLQEYSENKDGVTYYNVDLLIDNIGGSDRCIDENGILINRNLSAYWISDNGAYTNITPADNDVSFGKVKWSIPIQEQTSSSIRVIVSDGLGAETEHKLSITPKTLDIETVSISSVDSIKVGEYMHFNAESNYNFDYIFNWSFTDGGEKNGKSIQYSFLSPGSYRVNLEAINTIGNRILFSSKLIEVFPDENPENSHISTTLLAHYNQETKKFKLAWQSHNEVEQIVIYYSYDNSNWQTVVTQNIGSIKNGSRTVQIADSESHNRIFFKVKSKNIINDISVTGDVYTLDYSPSKPYVEKGTEIPAVPRLYGVGSSVDRDSITLLWQRVNDSHNNDNVSHYEIQVANNIAFRDARLIDAGNNALGENIYESVSYTVSNLEDGKQQYFRVRAVNTLGTGPWSNIESTSIQVQDQPSIQATPQFPQIDAVGVSKIPQFRWLANDPDGDELQFYITIGESPATMYQDSGWLTTNSQGTQQIGYDEFVSRTALKPNTTYYWQVKVREQGRKKDYYGGEYIKSPIWSFTTQATGSDLAIIDSQLVGELKPAQLATFKLTVKNVGTEKARDEWIQAYYKKDGTTTEFWNGEARISKELNAGESVEVNVTVEFRDDIWEKNGEVYDNVLANGDSHLIFDMPNLSSQDINPANNRKETAIHYENAGLPVFEVFYVYDSVVYNQDKSLVKGIIGKPLKVGLGISDDTKVIKAIVDYRLSANDSWNAIKTITNDDDYLQSSFSWDIPDDRSLISDSVELRVRAFESNGVDFSEKKAYFPIYSNKLEMQNLTFDRSNYTVGDGVIVSYDLVHDYDIKSLSVRLRNPDTGERPKIIDERYIDLGTQPAGAIQFTIPDDNSFAGDELFLEIVMWDVVENKIEMDSQTFSVKANTKLPSPFDSFIEVYKPLNTNFGTPDFNSSYNRVEKIIIDDNNLVHMVVGSVAAYSIDYRQYLNVDYYYMTYDFNSSQLSSPIKITTINQKRTDNFKDFALIDNKPYVLFGERYSTNNSLKHSITYKSGSSFSGLQNVLNKSTIKNGLVNFAQHNGKLFIKWVDTELGTNSSNRRNKSKAVYPSIGVERNIHSSYLGWDVRVNAGHLYATCGKLYTLNNDLTVGSLISEQSEQCYEPKGEFKDFSSSHSVIDFLQTSSGYGFVTLIKDDFTTVLLDDEKKNSEVAIYDDKIITVGFLNNENVVSIYDNDFNQLSKVSFGKWTDTTDVFAKADINRNKVMAVSRLERNRAYLTVADLSNDITAPNITLSSTDSIIEVGDSITLDWTASDNDDELVRYEVYKVASGVENLLETITNIATTSFTYTQSSNTDKFIQLKVVAYDSSGNSGYAVLPLKVQKKITFNSFTINKTGIDLGGKVIFSWSSSGGDESTQFTVSNKATDASEWNELFTTSGTSKAYVVKDLVGEHQFKIISGSGSKVADTTLTINGELLKFKEALFKPQINLSKLSSYIKFEWADTLTSPVSYDVWLKKNGESEFTNIGTTSDKYLDYFDDVGTAFQWKVSARFGEALEESNAISVSVENLVSPKITTISFELVENIPTINFSFPAVTAAESYVIVKQHDGIYEELPVAYQSSYSDTDINYGVSYDYSILAVKNGLRTEQGESKTILASLNEQYEVVIDTANNQLLDTNSLTVQYHPEKEIEYEQYEIWLGTSPDTLRQQAITENRQYEFSALSYTTNYYVEIYPIDLNGNHVSASPARLSFTTGFDSREITVKPVITIDEVGSYTIKLSWTGVENADEYKVCRSDNGVRYNCFVQTKELSYIDTVNIEPENNYQYKIQAVNGFNFSISEASDEVQTILSDFLRVSRDVSALVFDAIKLSNSAERNITGNLNLLKTGANGTEIIWSASSSFVNPATGVVTRPSDNDTNVSLEALVKFGDSSDTVVFNLVVKKEEAVDTDKDGVPDEEDAFPNDASEWADNDNDGTGDNADLDDDNDGLPDTWEIENGLNPKDASDADADADNDGATNKEEFEGNSDPNDSTSLPVTEFQIVSISSCSRVTSGSEVRCDIRYTTTDSNGNLSGLGVRLHFDANKLEWLGAENILVGNIFNADITPSNDVTDDDSDASTTEYVTTAWAGLQGSWPNQALPIRLFTARFKVRDGVAIGETTTIRFTPSGLAEGYGFTSEPEILTVVNGCTLDIDGDGQSKPLTDGLVLLRYLFGFRENALTSGALGAGSTRTDTQSLGQYIDGCETDFDIDGTGDTKPLTDGLLTLRYMFGFGENALIEGAVGVGAERGDAASITEYLDQRR